MKIITHEEAISKNLKTFFTGKPCLNDHYSERNVLSGHCVVCNREKQKAYRLAKNAYKGTLAQSQSLKINTLEEYNKIKKLSVNSLIKNLKHAEIDLEETEQKIQRQIYYINKLQHNNEAVKKILKNSKKLSDLQNVLSSIKSKTKSLISLIATRNEIKARQQPCRFSVKYDSQWWGPYSNFNPCKNILSGKRQPKKLIDTPPCNKKYKWVDK